MTSGIVHGIEAVGFGFFKYRIPDGFWIERCMHRVANIDLTGPVPRNISSFDYTGHHRRSEHLLIPLQGKALEHGSGGTGVEGKEHHHEDGRVEEQENQYVKNLKTTKISIKTVIFAVYI